jgi:rRNA maturation RNase YbeY
MSITISFSGRCGFLKKVNRDYFRTLIKRISESVFVNDISLNYIFMLDDELLEINREHLQHDYYTDIITFDLSNDESTIFGELYISKDRIKDHAKTYEVSEEEELIRVMSHGFLHLIGFNDKSEEEALLMRKEEERCLSLWREIKNVSRETITI